MSASERASIGTGVHRKLCRHLYRRMRPPTPAGSSRGRDSPGRTAVRVAAAAAMVAMAVMAGWAEHLAGRREGVCSSGHQCIQACRTRTLAASPQNLACSTRHVHRKSRGSCPADCRSSPSTRAPRAAPKRAAAVAAARCRSSSRGHPDGCTNTALGTRRSCRSRCPTASSYRSSSPSAPVVRHASCHRRHSPAQTGRISSPSIPPPAACIAASCTARHNTHSDRARSCGTGSCSDRSTCSRRAST